MALVGCLVNEQRNSSCGLTEKQAPVSVASVLQLLHGRDRRLAPPAGRGKTLNYFAVARNWSIDQVIGVEMNFRFGETLDTILFAELPRSLGGRGYKYGGKMSQDLKIESNSFIIFLGLYLCADILKIFF